MTELSTPTATARVASSPARRASAFDAIAAPAAVLDRLGTIVETNAAWRLFEKLNDAQPDTTGVGVGYLDVCDRARASDPGAGVVADALRAILEGDRLQAEVEYPCHSPVGDRWFVMQAAAAPVDDGGGAVVIHYDITARKVLEQGLLAQTDIDLHTGLPNEVAALRFVEGHLVAREDPPALSVVVVHLDGLEAVADRHGRPGVEETIAHAVSRARRSLRAGDALFRLGPDEIALVFPGLDRDSVAGVVARLLAAFLAPFQLGASELHLTVTCGVAVRDRGSTASALLDAARVDTWTPDTGDTGPGPTMLASSPARQFEAVRAAIERSSPIVTDAATAGTSDTSADRRLQLLLHRASDIVFVMTRDSRITYVSPSVESVLGYQPDTLLGLPGQLLIHPEDGPAFRATCAQVLAHPEWEPAPLVVRAVGADGSWHWGEVAIANRLGDPAVAGIVLNVRDVTERFEALSEIARERATREAIVAHSNELVIFFAPDGTIRWASPPAWRLFGLDLDALVGRNGLDLVHPDDRDRVLADLATIPNLGDSVRTEFRVIQPDGVVRWMEEVATNLVDEPSVGVVVGNLRDTTDRRQIEDAARFQSNLLAATGQPIVAVDNRGRVTYWNEAAHAAYGWSAEEALGRRILDLLPPTAEWVPEAREARERRVAGESWSGEISVTRKDGSTIPLLVTDTPVFDDDGARLGSIAVASDLTERKRSEASAALLAAIVGSSNDAIFSKTLDGAITSWNPGAEQLYGYTAAEIVGRPVGALMSPEYWHEGDEILDQIRQGETVNDFDTMRLGADGGAIHVSISVSPIRDGAGTIIGASTIARDITERAEFARRIDDDHRRLTEAQRSAHLGSFERDVDAETLVFSEELYAILGIPLGAALTTTSYRERVHPEDGAEVIARFGATLQSGQRGSITHRIVRGDGEVRWVHTRFGPVPGRPHLIAGTVFDITDHRKAELALEQLAYHDPVTGLPNRIKLWKEFAAALDETQRRQQTLLVALFDVEQFKTLNDSLGHMAGDELLVAVADRLRAAVAPGEILARFGSEEFAIVSPGPVRPERASELGDRILGSFGAPVRLRGREFSVSTSVGVVLCRPTDTADTVLRDAGAAMHDAKKSGPVRFAFFDEPRRDRTRRRLDLEIGLASAIDRDQLSVVFQPIVELAEGTTVGFEALLRWNHPDLGTVSPEEFIPIAEHSGLILPIGDFVLRQSLARLAEWRRRSPAAASTWVAVNLSAHQLEQSDLVADITRALAEAGLPPDALHLEITETVMMDDVDASLAKLAQLRALGTKTSIDDFGTGYSSLSYLKRLPIDTLKVDRAFISGLGTDRDDTSIVEAVLTLSRTLKLTVLAEGVETETQRAALVALGCTYGQGFLWSPGLPADDAFAWLTTGHHEAPFRVPVVRHPA